MDQRLSDTRSFDFEIGNLVKSPCRDCGIRDDRYGKPRILMNWELLSVKMAGLP